jgi:hypothetical protein
MAGLTQRDLPLILRSSGKRVSRGRSEEFNREEAAGEGGLSALRPGIAPSPKKLAKSKIANRETMLFTPSGICGLLPDHEQIYSSETGAATQCEK